MRRRTRSARWAAGALLAGAAAGCEFGTTAIDTPPPQVVVHAVLDPANLEQVVLVERTLTGRVDLVDPDDPEGLTGLEPVVNATVRLRSAAGGTWVAESPRSGVYTFATTGFAPLRAGERYTLEVRTREGETVTGTTTIPSFAGTRERTLRFFNRDRDTLTLQWPAVAGARSYALRVDSPLDPFFLFLDSTRIRLPGSLRNLFGDRLPRVFIPGFRQRVAVTAIDSNYFDYYRSRNDPFSGSGLISRVQGGLGLVGSVVNLRLDTMVVSANVDEPVEGSYVLRTGSGPLGLDLWVETPATSHTPAFLSGRYQRTFSAGPPQGILGTLTGTRVALAFLTAQSRRDTALVFTGEVRGDTLVGAFGTGIGGAATYLRIR